MRKVPSISNETICVCGAGAIAHVLAAQLGANPANDVRVLTRRPAEWSSVVKANYRDQLEVVGTLTKVSSHASEVIPDAGMVLIALPAFAHRDVLVAIAPYLEQRTWVGALPGTGGFDWVAREVLPPSVRIFGLARTPYLCRTSHYGHEAEVAGVANELLVASIPRAEQMEIVRRLEAVLHIPARACKSYLTVTLTPGNPLVHPARLHSLFRDASQSFRKIPKFYAEWDDGASETMFRCDAELQQIRIALGLASDERSSIQQHYGVTTPSELSNRIRLLESLRGVTAPMLLAPNGFAPNTKHRFFTEDIPYGTLIMRAVGEICGIATPALDMLIRWGEEMTGLTMLNNRDDCVSRESSLPIPQRFGITTLADLVQSATQ